MTSYFEIKNWLEYQHYGDKKRVPWIKLEYEVLTSEDFSVLNDKAKLLMIVCMLIASRHNGKVPNNPKHVQRLGNLDSVPDFKPLIDCGFLICNEESRNVLTESRQIQNESTCSLSSSSSISFSESGKGGVGEKPKRITLEALAVEHVADWLKQKRAEGKYLSHDENAVLEGFKDYCVANGKRYTDYVAAYRNAFEWERFSSVKKNGFVKAHEPFQPFIKSTNQSWIVG